MKPTHALTALSASLATLLITTHLSRPAHARNDNAPAHITARSLTIVDDHARERVRISCSDAASEIRLLDEHANTTLILASNGDHHSITLGRAYTIDLAASTSLATLQLHRPDADKPSIFAITDPNHAKLAFFNRDGKPLISLAQTPMGQMLLLANPENAGRFIALSHQRGVEAAVTDVDGDPIWKMPGGQQD